MLSDFLVLAQFPCDTLTTFKNSSFQEISLGSNSNWQPKLINSKDSNKRTGFPTKLQESAPGAVSHCVVLLHGENATVSSSKTSTSAVRTHLVLH
ncbi:hypothetical protein CRENBAI_021064 [Crenichthys baileyi]|uniref:Uncharacterized protein n=1 Tax=Crenichthys baileyi TaxID=28760 RepID=A0AAV9SA60_9TELE